MFEPMRQHSHDGHISQIPQIYPYSATIRTQFTCSKKDEFKRIVDLEERVLDEQLNHFVKPPKEQYRYNPNYIEENLAFLINSNLQEINFRDFRRLPLELLCRFGFHAKNIERIDFTNQPITDAVLAHIGDNLKHLKGLRIGNCKGITEAGMRSFLRLRGNQLVDFCAPKTPQAITKESLEFLDISNLRILDIEACNQIDKFFFERFEKAERLQLEILNISDLGKVCEWTAINKLLQLASSTLQTFIARNTGLSSIHFSALSPLGGCTEIKYIDLSGFSDLTDEILFNINPQWTHIRVFNIKMCKNVSEFNLLRLLRLAPSLKHIDLSINDIITDSFLINLCAANPLPKTIVLNLTPKIPAKSLERIIATYSQIHFIRSLEAMSNPNDSGLRVPLLPKDTEFGAMNAQQKNKR